MTDPLIAMLRRDEQDTFDGRCTIKRPSNGEGTTDPVTGDYTPSAPTTIHTNLPCRARPDAQATREVDIAGTRLALHLYDVRIEHDKDVQRDDLITFTESRDPLLVGASGVIREVVADEWVVTRRLLLEDPQ